MPGFVPVRRRRSMTSRHQAAYLTLLYVLAACLPAITVETTGYIPGMYIGPRVFETVHGFFCCFIWFAPWWWANPLFLLGIVFLACGIRLPAIIFGVLATLIALHVLMLVPNHYTDLASHDEMDGLHFPLHSGYFVWLVCMMLLSVCAYFMPDKPEL